MTDLPEPMVVEVPYYCIPRREEDNRRNGEFERLFTNVQRWWPQPREDDDEGLARLRQLANGERISAEHLNKALDYCHQAIAWYQGAPEPFPGNNDLATADFMAMLAALQQKEEHS